MKNRILIILCVLVVAFSLTACDEEKPYEDTEIEIHTQEDTGEVENTQETDLGIPFLASDITFFSISKENFDNHLSEGHIVALLSSEEEWHAWRMEYLPGYNGDKVFEHYNPELFENNYLLIYQGDLRQYGHKTTGVERIFVEYNEIRIEEFDLHNESLMTDSSKQQHYITYQMCWIKKQDISGQVYEKYKAGSYQCFDGMSAYYIYPNLGSDMIEVKYTHNGGVTWEESRLTTDTIDLGTHEVETCFLSSQVGYVLHTVTSAKNPPRVRLWITRDGAASWWEIGGITWQMSQEYPMELLFFDELRGCILTEAVQSPLLSGINYSIYYTEDGGRTWTGRILEYPMHIIYESLYVTGIEKISKTEGKLYVTVDEIRVEGYEGTLETKNCVYYTKDAGKTWEYKSELVHIYGEADENE